MANDPFMTATTTVAACRPALPTAPAAITA
jgi:hypothetical protein